MIQRKLLTALVAVTVAIVMGATMTGVVSASNDLTITSATVYQWGRITITGTASPGAQVGIALFHAPSPTVTTTAAADGSYTLSLFWGMFADAYNDGNLGPIYIEVVDLNNNIRVPVSTLTPVGATLTLNTLTSDPIAGHDFTLTGTLKDTNGQPVPAGDVEVLLKARPSGADLSSDVALGGRITTSDASTGAFSLPVTGGLPAGSYVIDGAVYTTAFGTPLNEPIGSYSSLLTFTVQAGYKEHALSAAQDLKDNTYIPARAFTTTNNHNAFDNKLQEVINYINAGDYATALAKVQRDVMPKADGKPSPADWVTSDSQGVIYTQLRSIESDLITLLS